MAFQDGVYDAAIARDYAPAERTSAVINHLIACNANTRVRTLNDLTPDQMEEMHKFFIQKLPDISVQSTREKGKALAVLLQSSYELALDEKSTIELERDIDTDNLKTAFQQMNTLLERFQGNANRGAGVDVLGSERFLRNYGNAGNEAQRIELLTSTVFRNRPAVGDERFWNWKVAAVAAAEGELPQIVLEAWNRRGTEPSEGAGTNRCYILALAKFLGKTMSEEDRRAYVLALGLPSKLNKQKLLNLGYTYNGAVFKFKDLFTAQSEPWLLPGMTLSLAKVGSAIGLVDQYTTTSLPLIAVIEGTSMNKAIAVFRRLITYAGHEDWANRQDQLKSFVYSISALMARCIQPDEAYMYKFPTSAVRYVFINGTHKMNLDTVSVTEAD
jgi:hypothetical protein